MKNSKNTIEKRPIVAYAIVACDGGDGTTSLEVHPLVAPLISPIEEAQILFNEDCYRKRIEAIVPVISGFAGYYICHEEGERYEYIKMYTH